MTDTKGGQCENTDRELWREREGDFYADSIHVTQEGWIGMNVGGLVIAMPVKEWHRLACKATGRRGDELERLRALNAEMRAALTNLVECLELAERNDDLPLPFAGYGYDFITKARAAIAKAAPQPGEQGIGS